MAKLLINSNGKVLMDENGKVYKAPPSQIETEEKTVTPTKSQQIITPTTGKYLSKVTVNTIPSSYIIPSGNKEITENGTNIDVRNYETVDVNVHTGITPSGTLDITENGTYNVTEYAGVNVNVISGVTLKKFLDTTKSAASLFSGYTGASVDDLISYSDTENVTDTSYMFISCPNLHTILLLNTSNTTNMEGMFRNCTKLQTIPQLNTSKVTSMRFMFYLCKNLQSIPQIDTSNVTSMSSMFESCQNLQKISQLNTSNVTDMSTMFKNCTNLQTIDITHMKLTGTTYSYSMCRNCHSLTKLVIRNMDKIPILDSGAFELCYHFTGTRDSAYNPNGLKDGRIYVPDDKVKAVKAVSGWKTYADIIVGLSELYIWVTTSQSFTTSMTVGFNINGELYFGTTEKYSIDLGPNAKNISISSSTSADLSFAPSLSDYSYNSTTGILTINRLYNKYPTTAFITINYDERKLDI